MDKSLDSCQAAGLSYRPRTIHMNITELEVPTQENDNEN